VISICIAVELWRARILIATSLQRIAFPAIKARLKSFSGGRAVMLLMASTTENFN
jgi:hypothetical protein